MTYQWRYGSKHVTKAAVAGAVCEELERTGGLTAKRLVDVSRPKNAPLHREFEWDDSEAAEKYREYQARGVINSLIIIRKEIDIEEQDTALNVLPPGQPVRKFFKIEVSDAYESIDNILMDREKRDALMHSAMRDMESFRRKYEVLSELQPVIEAMEHVALEDRTA